VERNIVVTQWNWGFEDSYIHDEVATDKRNPLLYPYGKVYGIDIGQDILWALDPVKNAVTSYPVPTRPGYGPRSSVGRYNNPANPHNPMLDDQGKVWITTQVRGERPEDRPKWTKNVISADIVADKGVSLADKLASEDEGSHHRQLGYFDTKNEEMVLIDTAYGTHHLQFDRYGRLWTSGDTTALGMFNPKEFDPKRQETEILAQRAFMNVDPKTGKPVPSNFPYGIIVSPVDGTIWRAHPASAGPGNKISKFDPRTTTFKDYPLPPPGRGPRGIDATTDGKLWFGTGSGHLGRFDPRTEKFTYWDSPGPRIRGMNRETGSADFHYYIWVDQFDTFGLGKDMVILTGTDSDSLIVFDPVKEHFTVIRIPFPLGMYHRGLDGRIDDAKAGWKGRGLWVDNGQDPVFFSERKIGFLNHIQVRPDPLAR
jgi:streptogramin lyase